MRRRLNMNIKEGYVGDAIVQAGDKLGHFHGWMTSVQRRAMNTMGLRSTIIPRSCLTNQVYFHSGEVNHEQDRHLLRLLDA